ncbi:MAG: caspase family protein, partial [Pseudomonadota bacterium]
MRKIIPLLLILFFHLSGCSQSPPITNPPPVQPKKTPSSKHALLIGIENYNHPKITNLEGAINDVKLMQGVLRTRFDFQDDDFITLLNEQATHTCIENAFKTLIKRVRSNDFVYIHYAGHGSQTPDLNGDERSGQDQTWVSFGTRQPGRKNEKDNYEVLDD